MEFQSRAVENLIQLHELELRKLLEVWKEAKKRDVPLPTTDDPAYANLDHLMQHPLRSARGYLTWICEKLGRPDPAIPPAPSPEAVPAEADAYLETLLAAWREHLAWMDDQTLSAGDVHQSRWDKPYTIEEMLEHGVVHPMRHRQQLVDLMRKAGGA